MYVVFTIGVKDMVCSVERFCKLLGNYHYKFSLVHHGQK